MANGSWNGLIDMLMKGEIDIAVGPWTVTYTRSQAINFTYPFYEDPTGILIPPPRDESKVWACTQPYTTEVWLGLLVCLVTLPLLLWFVLCISRNGLWIRSASYPGFQPQFDFIIGVILSQSGRCSVNTHTSRTLAATWCLATVILINVYTSTLMSNLTIPKQKALVDSIDDVAMKGVLTVTVVQSTSMDSLMLDAKNGTYKLLGDSLRRRPETRVRAFQDGFAKALGGKHAFALLPPFSVFPTDRNKTSEYTGLAFEVFKTVARRLNWTYDVLSPPNAVPGAKLGNGSWSGLVGMLLKGEVDISIGPWTITHDRAQAIDFTYPFYEDPTGLLIPPPRKESKVWACTQPYTAEVWLSLVACLVILPVLLWFVLRISRNGLWIGTTNYPKLRPHFDFIIGVFLAQSGRCNVNTHASRTLAATWCLATVILVNVYTSTLMSYLTIPKQKALVDSIEDVATKDELTISVMQGTSMESVMLTANQGIYKTLGDSLRLRPETRVPSLIEGFAKALDGKHAFAIDKSALEEMIYNDYMKHDTCRATLAKNSFDKSYMAFMVSKESDFLQRINLELIRLHEVGLISYWATRSMPPRNPCAIIKVGGPKSASLKLDDLQSAFVVYGIGNMVAVVMFVIEHTHYIRISMSFS